MSEAPAPTPAAAQARIAAVRPDDYARTRNHLDGAATGLSPYLTHGFVTLAEVHDGVAARHPLGPRHKLVYELGWRAYFRHVWRQRGDGILRSLHDGPLPDEAYTRELPADVREARSGLPVVDEAVRTLYATGLLHNHARLWLASALVHLRKIHWRTGADWLYGHLLDGDLASNHLSWQWVAGTASRQPYLFDADNVARLAPPAWHSAGSVVDTGRDELERLARDPAGRGGPVREGLPPTPEPPCFAAPPAALGFGPPDPAAVAGRDVWLVHPWRLADLPPALPSGTVVVALCVAELHRAWPWSARRWAFVGPRLASLATQRWHADAAAIGDALRGARSVRSTDEPHLAPWLGRWAVCAAEPALFADVTRRCDSFSQWWKHAAR